MLSPLSAANAYDLARTATAPGVAQGGVTTGPRPGGLASAGDRFLATLEGIDATAQGALAGPTGTQELVQTIAEAELALETVVAIRDKVVEAYQEILRMPV